MKLAYISSSRVTGQGTHCLQRTLEQVNLIVRVHALQNRDDPFETHPGIHVLGRQRFECVFVNAVVLDEDVVPQFEVALAFTVHTTPVRFPGQVVKFLAPVEVDLRTRPAGTGLSHFPEVFLAPEEQHMRWVESGLLLPDLGGFIVGGDVALVVLETGGIQPVFRQAPDICQQLPGPGNGFFFVIIAKRPVAEHLKEGVVAVVAANFIEVVVLAGHAQALSASRPPGCKVVYRYRGKHP